MQRAMQSGRISGDAPFTQRCHRFFEEKCGFNKSFLTTSCTHALEMAALLSDIQPGDEVIMPSYTFVSTANAFALRGAKIVFADSSPDNPNIDARRLERHITPKTKALVVVHYAGIACDMDAIMAIAEYHNLLVIEDAAQAIDAYHYDRPLGSIGHFGAFSFHETKNITCGEGGLLTVNVPTLAKRAEIIREKGTNRAAFYRGEVDKYGWVDIWSSFLPSDLLAAFLYAQLEGLPSIQQKRLGIWENYRQMLAPLAETGAFSLPFVPAYARHNAHIFYLVFPNGKERDRVMKTLREVGIQAPFHYLSLHGSRYFKEQYGGPPLFQSDRYTHCLLRLPLYADLTGKEQLQVVGQIHDCFAHKLNRKVAATKVPKSGAMV